MVPPISEMGGGWGCVMEIQSQSKLIASQNCSGMSWLLPMNDSFHDKTCDIISV